MPDPVVSSGKVPAFDALAAGYDARVGFPPGVGEAIAAAIVHLGQVDADDLVLELGAGTGDIGVHLSALAPSYVGLDNSPAMLDLFQAKASPWTPCLLVADAGVTWPLAEASAQVIFASRMIHLLQPNQVTQEATRVCRPGGYLMLGRVKRDADSLKERLRQRRQDLLRNVGINPRAGEPGSRYVIERLVQAGWADLGRQAVTSWTGEISAGDVIGEWDTITRMGSVEVEEAIRERILTDLRDWAMREFGELDRPMPYHEQYVIEIARRPHATSLEGIICKTNS